MTSPVPLTVALLAVGVSLYLIVRVARFLLRSRRDLAELRASGDDPASIRPFVQAHTKLMRMSAILDVVACVGLIMSLGLARQAIIELGQI